MSIRIEKTFDLGDTIGALNMLRNARRSNDVSAVLDACGALIVCMPTPWVREALRWSVDFMGEVMQGHQAGPCIRIANLARLLPNPQPDPVVETIAKKRPASSGGRVRVQRRTVINPTHALRLYIDALMIAKGEGWCRWLVPYPDYSVEEESKHYRTGSNPFCDHHGGASIWLDGNIIGNLEKDGTVICGATCPPLPEVA